jgi:hypothetical protein
VSTGLPRNDGPLDGPLLDAYLEHEDVRIALADLLARSGLTQVELVELVEHGAFEPGAPSGISIEQWTFSVRSVRSLTRVMRLREDFALHAPGTALVMALLERIDELERHLDELRCQLPR